MSQWRMPSLFSRLVHVLMLFLLPLCAGAVWSVAAQVLRHDLPVASLLLALVHLLMRGQLGFFGRGTRMVLHGLATLVGIVYAQALMAGVAVAQQFGDGPIETLQRMGSAMTLDLVVTRLDWIEGALFAGAIALAIWIGGRTRGPEPALKPRSVP